MERSPVLVAVVLGGAALAGCDSGAKMTAHYTTAPPTTISGVGVITSGPPPKPNTPSACARRWNGTANTSGRAAARSQAPKAQAALIRRAESSGYFSDVAGRCLIYLLSPPKSVVFVEAAPGKFVFTAHASGKFSANADLRRDGRLRLR